MSVFINSFIHDKPTYRKIFILSTLDNGQKLISAQTLANELNCSIRTITNDISQLKKEIPKKWEIIGIITKGYVLKKPVNDSIYPIFYSYIKESNITKIMTGIFNNKIYSLEKWSQLLYANKLTLKQNLNYHNKLLQKIELKFKFRSVQLVGKELNIRFYYHKFFYMINVLSNSSLLPHDKILMEKLSNILNSHAIVIDMRMIESIILVFITRFSCKQYITKIDTDIFPENCNSNELLCFNKMIIAIESYYKINLPKNEKVALKLYFFLVSVSNFEQGKHLIEFLKSTNKKYYDNYLGFFNNITEENNVEVNAKSQMIIELTPFYYKSVLHSYFGLTREFYFSPLNILPNELLPKYKKNLDRLSIWNVKYNTNNLKKNDLECLIANATIIMEPFIEKINILFLYSGTTAKFNVYYTMLEKQLSDTVVLHMNYNINCSYDFIITNTPQNKLNIPVLYISDNLSTHEIDHIKNKIYR
ncbi:hypothetical protein BTT_59240 (plasmid) [Bacillus thuringiensis serovar morrisoni str. 4AA1]|nr:MULTISPECIES: helix-turn-helix domain containing protein [Bacillus]MED3102192.1 helix-turn-helix domain containing protein [Bacillus thuringiensis]MRA99107.1 HTH domain-containing protein [Bacillus thuringiensis]OTY31047.1 hypothetical protein BK736_26445 [Bacillus thuringiensis serovar poloniensis]RUR59428.1 HTH domain-containing protein [Bacillus sp. VKPM B-3276]UEL01012.1 helix-turn-helix domain-containing protein [Bacillus thuringiensis]